MVKCQEYVSKNTIQQTAEVDQPLGTDKSVPYEHAGRRPVQLPVKFQFAGELIKADSLNSDLKVCL